MMHSAATHPNPTQSHYSLMQAPYTQEFIASSIACGWVKIMRGKKQAALKAYITDLRGIPQSAGLRLPCDNPSRCYSRLQYIWSTSSSWSAKTPRGQVVNADFLSQKNLAFCSCTPSWLHGRKKIEKPSTTTAVYLRIISSIAVLLWSCWGSLSPWHAFKSCHRTNNRKVLLSVEFKCNLTRASPSWQLGTGLSWRHAA